MVAAEGGADGRRGTGALVPRISLHRVGRLDRLAADGTRNGKHGLRGVQGSVFHYGRLPKDVVPGLIDKLAPPVDVGRSAGKLQESWRQRCGIRGEPVVAVAVINSHVMMPAVGATEPGTFVGAWGTSAAYLLFDNSPRPLPAEIEGVARDGVIPGLWCYEAGQPAFGDVLGWFVREFAGAQFADGCTLPIQIRTHGSPAWRIQPRRPGLVEWLALSALQFERERFTDRHDPEDNADGCLSGSDRVIVFRRAKHRPALDFRRRAAFASYFCERSCGEKSFPHADDGKCLGSDSGVRARIRHAAAIGAAIHSAVAAGVVADFRSGASRYGASDFVRYTSQEQHVRSYERLFRGYSILSSDPRIREVMHCIKR